MCSMWMGLFFVFLHISTDAAQIVKKTDLIKGTSSARIKKV